MLSIIKKLLRIAPTPEENDVFSPSPLALRLATKSQTDYDHTTYPNAYKGGKLKVLMVCTQELFMTMRNGKKFSTGNHPVEMLVPMLHLEKAGFGIDVFTATGNSVKIEMWAMPEKDLVVKEMYEKYKARFTNPNSLKEFVQDSLIRESPYIAVFIPGGHGAMLGLPENHDLEKTIHWAFKNEKYMLSICHGPAALLAANLSSEQDSFVYKNYKMAVFPDWLDKITPSFGYLPGHMPWYFGEKLKQLGVKMINNNASGICHQDRKLITGDSPDAANKFGKMAAEALLSEVNN